MENPTKMDDLGVPSIKQVSIWFRGAPNLGYLHIVVFMVIEKQLTTIVGLGFTLKTNSIAGGNPIVKSYTTI